jgi:hypothetical protein
MGPVKAKLFYLVPAEPETFHYGTHDSHIPMQRTKARYDVELSTPE